MRKISRILVLALLLLSVCAVAADYPQWRGINRDGVADEAGLLDKWPADGPAQLWVAEAIGVGYSSPIEVDGKTYITGMKNENAVLTALNSIDGNILWQVQYGPSWAKKQYAGERSTPTFSNGKLYIMNPEGQLFCFMANDGKQVWMVDTQKDMGARNITWGLTESVVVDDNKVYCTPGAQQCGVAAFDKNDGSLIWKTGDLGKSAYCSPVIVEHNGKKMLITMMDALICGIDVTNGHIMWQAKHKAAYGINAITPIYDDGICYVSNGYKLGGRALKIAPEGSSAQEIWTDKRLDCQLGGLSYSKGLIYGIGQNGNIIILSIKTGKVIAASEPYAGKGALVMADGKLFCYGESSKVALVTFDGSKFKLCGNFDIKLGEKEHWAHPVVSNGKLYIRHGDFLMAYNVAK